MEFVTHSEALRRVVSQWRRDGARVGFVPTMGNLHAGHFSLIDAARAHVDKVVASVFVNPTQFGPNEDFASYPRTLEQDRKNLRSAKCDLLFAPAVEEMYPFGAQHTVRVEVPGISDVLDGAARPGHFTGVATVVTKLLNLVAPDVAVFGQKDYQQLLVIRRLVADLRLPIEIIGAPTVREKNGLAMSSRNQYLTSEERERAGVIFATLQSMQTEIRNGKSWRDVEKSALSALESAGLKPDYAVLRDRDNLSEPSDSSTPLVALIAARLGRARLIDNVTLKV